jgi:5'-nucleotidase
VEIGGVEIGVVGATVSGATRYLPPRGIASLRFTDEAQAINAEVDALKARGVRAIVVALHQGGEQDFAAPSGSPPVAGRIVDIVSALSPEVDLVVSGHTHTLVNAVMRNRDGGPLLVTQAASAGTAFSHVALRISRETGDLLSATSRIVSTFADEGPGLTPDPEVSALVARFEKAVAARVDAVVGVADEELPNEPTCSGEMALGDLVADAQRASVDADIALVTPAWLRDGLAAGPITWGDLFTVQPFGNRVVSVALTGSALLAILEAQWTDPDKVRVLQISGFTYAWDPGAPPGHRVHDVVVNGRPLDPNATYRTAVSDFLADGGDNLGVLASLRRTPEEADDVEAIVDLLRSRDGRASGASRPRIERRAAAAATTP